MYEHTGPWQVQKPVHNTNSFEPLQIVQRKIVTRLTDF
jgi:hypothetical protein